MTPRGVTSWETVRLVVFLFLGMPVLLCAQEFPTKPMNVVVTYNPGGAIDTSSRLILEAARASLGQPFIVTANVSGGGSVAAGVIAREKPDGYHLICTSGSVMVRVPLFRTVSCKLDDFVPIMQYGLPADGIVVRSDSPFKTLNDLVQYARENPGKVTYATFGTGDAFHMGMEFIAKQEGIQWKHVPSVMGDATLLLLGNNVTAIAHGATFIPHVRAGSLRLLATLGEKRTKAFPDAPTLKELGYDYVNDTVLFFAAPKATPTPIVKKLDGALRKALDDPKFVKYMEDMNMTIA